MARKLTANISGKLIVEFDAAMMMRTEIRVFHKFKGADDAATVQPGAYILGRRQSGWSWSLGSSGAGEPRF
jgi:hypothetical protein